MSFCRWSSNNWDCDLYCYESDTGFVTHVAGNRIVGEVPEVLPLSAGSEAWCASYNAQMEFLRTAKRKPIGLPCDGQSFTDPDKDEFVERVKGLVGMGYHAPPNFIEWIERDAP